MDSKSMILTYKILVHLHLEYAVPVWSPHLAKDISNLERVQKFGLIKNVSVG